MLHVLLVKFNVNPSHSFRHVHSILQFLPDQRENIQSYKNWRARGSVVVKALCYKPEGRGLDIR
jgi:hypothetical protein